MFSKSNLMECSKASGRNANRVILYEDAAKKQLQELIMNMTLHVEK